MIVYVLGLLLIVSSWVEIASGNQLRTEITALEEQETTAIALRLNLMDLKIRYDELWFDLLELDMNSYGNVNFLGADETETYKNLMVNVLQFSNAWWDFKSLYVEGIHRPEIKWLFTEGIFTLWFYRSALSEDAKMAQILVDVKDYLEVDQEISASELQQWDIQWIEPDSLDFAFDYVYTTFAYDETFVAYEDTLEGRRVTIEQPGVIFETADEARCRAERADEDVLRAACRSASARRAGGTAR